MFQGPNFVQILDRGILTAQQTILSLKEEQLSAAHRIKDSPVEVICSLCVNDLPEKNHHGYVRNKSRRWSGW